MSLSFKRLPYMKDRVFRISHICSLLGDRLDVTKDHRYTLNLAAQYHDIGLLAIPDALLMKAGPLTPEERALVNEHCAIGGRLIAQALPDYPETIEAIWFHHENYDGSGPQGVEGSCIPLHACIIRLAEGVEAMANDRPYRKKMPLCDLEAEVVANSGKQFAPTVVEGFRKIAQKAYKAACAA
ncbi:MAG: hypothetical protein IMZ46_19750 [Acidobacteria bacterium]|nr:hypothetical protein [Acidobacteriota bacterium]